MGKSKNSQSSLEKPKSRESKQSDGVGIDCKSDGIHLSVFPEYFSLFPWDFDL